MHKLSVLFFGLLIAWNTQAQSFNNDRKLIKQTLGYYIDGVTYRDSATLRKAFHPDARLQGMRNGKYVIVPINKYISWFKPAKEPYKGPKRARIVSMNLGGKVAQAKIVHDYPKYRFIDYMQLLKVGNDWKIVNKAFFFQRYQAKKVLFVITNHKKLGDTKKVAGAYVPEIAHPYAVFDQKGYKVDFVSPKGGKIAFAGLESAAVDGLTQDFFRDRKHIKHLKNTLSPNQVKIEDYAAIFYVGGKGTMWDFPDNSKLQEITAQLYESKKVVGAVCHGPSGLLNVKLKNGKYLLKGHNVTGYSNAEDARIKHILPFLLEDRLKERGGKYTKAPKKYGKHVVVSGQLVTGQNPASAIGVAEEMIQLIEKNNH